MRSFFLPAAAALVLLATYPAHAGDDLDLIDAPELQISAATAQARNWYARADFGYAAAVNASRPAYRAFGEAGYTGFDEARFSRPFSVGGGIGYQFTDMFRGDLTADIFEGDLAGTSSRATRCSAAEPVGTGCAFSHDAEYRAVGVMANAYADLGTVVGLTPYVGAGIGVAHVSWNRFDSQPACVAGGAACSGTAYGVSALNGDQSFRFSYAVMAGLSYDVTDRVKLDVGYRYFDIAGGTAAFATDGQIEDHGFARHEIRAGLRISLW